MKVHIDGDYAERRRAEYPSIAEQLDALWKGGQDEADMRQLIASIKAKYPKLIAAPR